MQAIRAYRQSSFPGFSISLSLAIVVNPSAFSGSIHSLGKCTREEGFGNQIQNTDLA